MRAMIPTCLLLLLTSIPLAASDGNTIAANGTYVHIERYFHTDGEQVVTDFGVFVYAEANGVPGLQRWWTCAGDDAPVPPASTCPDGSPARPPDKDVCGSPCAIIDRTI